MVRWTEVGEEDLGNLALRGGDVSLATGDQDCCIATGRVTSTPSPYKVRDKS